MRANTLAVKSMKEVLFLCAAVVALLADLSLPVAAEDQLRVDVKQLGQMKFPTPDNPLERKYLGLSGPGEFKLTDVKAKYVIVEVFSMYCPICQKEAPKVNQCHEFIEKNPAHSGLVKVIGVGTGNTPFEVDVFRKKFSIPFPLFPDENFMAQKAFSQPIRTPTFITVRNRGKKGLELVNFHVGELGTAEAFLRNLPLAP